MGPREACRDDAKTFCKGIQPGGGRILDCLEDHYKEISDACYSALQKMPPHGGGQAGRMALCLLRHTGRAMKGLRRNKLYF